MKTINLLNRVNTDGTPTAHRRLAQPLRLCMTKIDAFRDWVIRTVETLPK